MLGKGGFAQCFRATDLQTFEELAAKVVDKKSIMREAQRQKLMTEIKLHRTLKHKNIVEFKRFFEDKYDVYIMLELCEHHSLAEMLYIRKHLHEIEVRCIVKQLCDALTFLHDCQIVHRDIKLSNVFINKKMQLKLGDFGLA